MNNTSIKQRENRLNEISYNNTISRKNGRGVIDGDGYDSFQRYSPPQSPSNRRLQQSTSMSSYNLRPEQLDEGTDNSNRLAPPKVTDSINLPRSSTKNMNNNDNRRSSMESVQSQSQWRNSIKSLPDNDFDRFNSYNNNNRPSSPSVRSSYNTMNYTDPYRRSNHYTSTSRPPISNSTTTLHASPPRISPSRIGSMMWGKKVPLSKKGVVPTIDKQTWCCAVCMYMENPTGYSNCSICDSPNYNERKVS